MRKFILLLLLISIMLLNLIGIGLSTFYFTQEAHIEDYSILFDAGSSGTRMYIYKWNANYKPNSNIKLDIKQSVYCENEDRGIDKIKDVAELAQKFDKCIKQANETIPDDRKPRTRISLVATAGMRLMEVNSRENKDRIFNLIRSYFNTTGYLFTNESQVKIITGKDEALDAWITANYLEKNFNSNKQGTKGILDLGGASTQILFVPKPDYNGQNSKKIKLFGNEYNTYSQSFLCYGLNEANLMYRAALLKKNNYNTAFNRAFCYPRGSNLNLTKSQFNKSPCANGNMFKDSVQTDLLQQDYTFYGESNYNYCAQDIRELLTERQPCTAGTDACSFKDQFIADVSSHKFLAFSSFWYALNESKRLFKRPLDGDLKSFTEITEELCSMTISQISNLNQASGAGLDKSRLVQLCFQNSYVIELLKKYGFDDMQSIQIVDSVNGFGVGWTLGYFINELNDDGLLPDEIRPRRLSVVKYALIVTGLGLFFVGLVMSLVYLYMTKWRRETCYV